MCALLHLNSNTVAGPPGPEGKTGSAGPRADVGAAGPPGGLGQQGPVILPFPFPILDCFLQVTNLVRCCVLCQEMTKLLCFIAVCRRPDEIVD